MQQKLTQKEKEVKEENLRLLAQRAREERSCCVSQTTSSRPTAESRAAVASTLGGYGSNLGLLLARTKKKLSNLETSSVLRSAASESENANVEYGCWTTRQDACTTAKP